MVSFFKGIVRAASLALCLAGANCGEDGMKVRGDYPNLTQEIKSDLEARVLALIESKARIVEGADSYRPVKETDERPAVSFRDTPKELINYFIDFTQEEYEAKDISLPDLKGLRISLLPENEVKDICGDEADGCYNMVEHKITILENLGIQQFFSMFNHEFGHHVYSGNGEFPSVANASYSAIKAYQFSLPIGSIMAPEILSYRTDNEFIYTYQFYQMYITAAMFAPVNLMDHEGDIEKAMDYLASTKMFTIESRLDDKLAGLEGQSDLKVSFAFWNELLDSIDFEYNLVKEDTLYSVSPRDAHEFVGYSRLLNYEDVTLFLPYDTDVKNQYHALLEDFVVNWRPHNPRFLGYSVSKLTEKLAGDMFDVMFTPPIDWDALYGICKKIVDVNSQYPCTAADPYACPEIIRGIRREHVEAYATMSQAAFAGDDNRRREAERYAIGFLVKFYPGVDFFNGDFASLGTTMQEETNNYVPMLMSNAGATSFGYDLCLSERFFRAATAVSCMETGRWPTFEFCESEKSYAEAYIEYILEIGGCGY